MDEQFWNIASEVPGLAVMALIVWIFVKHIGKANECYTKTIERNSKALDKVHEALGENIAYLRKQNGHSQ